MLFRIFGKSETRFETQRQSWERYYVKTVACLVSLLVHLFFFFLECVSVMRKKIKMNEKNGERGELKCWKLVDGY
jgi:hypothetical protein